MSGELKCSGCGQVWGEMMDSVIKAPNFDSTLYWGEIPRARMQHVLARSKVVGPTRALTEWTRATGNQYVERYALDPRRALCLELVDLPDNCSILDYGCGFGTIGLSAAPICKTVYLADSTLERIQFAKLRAIEQDASNVVALAIQNWGMLPIPNTTLDLIVLNGVLEWIPMYSAGDPLTIQTAFLGRMRELLRPGGAIFIGIENRYALRYFAGYPDDHSEARFTSIMPRKLADLYCNLRFHHPYRTVTWSFDEYSKNIENLGFTDVEIFCLYPDYRFPEVACRITDRESLNRLHTQAYGKNWKKTMGKLIDIFHLWPWLVYSYGIVARKSG